jgi:hypothetical protein
LELNLREESNFLVIFEITLPSLASRTFKIKIIGKQEKCARCSYVSSPSVQIPEYLGNERINVHID